MVIKKYKKNIFYESKEDVYKKGVMKKGERGNECSGNY